VAPYLIAYGYLKSKYAIYEYAPKNGTVCSDGWISSSLGSGTSSHHGGVKIWAGGSRATGEFDPNWWVKERTKLFAVLIVLAALSLGAAVIVSRRPDELTRDQREKLDAAMKAFDEDLAKKARDRSAHRT